MTPGAEGRSPAVTLLIAFTGLATIGMVWGMTLPLTKVAVSTGYQPIGLIFWQFLFSAFWLGLVSLVLRMPVRLTARHLHYYLVIGLIGTLVPNSFSYLAAARLPAGIMGIAVATVPMFVLVIALAVGNEAFRSSRFVGIFLGVTAMVLIALPETSLPDPAMAPWVLVALIAPVCYGVEGNYIQRRAPQDVHPVPALFAASVIGALLAGFLAWPTGLWVDLFKPWRAPEWAILGNATAHAAAYAGYMWLVGFAGAVFSSQVAYLVTAFAVLFSMMFLGEAYSGWVWAAMGLMFAGLFLVQPAGKLPEAITD